MEMLLATVTVGNMILSVVGILLLTFAVWHKVMNDRHWSRDDLNALIVLFLITALAVATVLSLHWLRTECVGCVNNLERCVSAHRSSVESVPPVKRHLLNFNDTGTLPISD